MTSDGKLGVVILSYEAYNGSHQRVMYVPALQAHPRVRIVAVADTPDAPAQARETGRAEAGLLGVPYREDLDELLAEPEVDAVCLGCDLDRRLALIQRVARAGKAIYSDKPMCRTVDDALGIVRAVEAADVAYMVGHNYRFSDAARRAHATVRSGKLGLPWAVHTELIIGEGVRAYPLGELTNFLLYPADVIRYVTGADFETVYAASGSFFFDNAKANQVEDLGVISFQMQHSILGTLTVGRAPTHHINGYNGDRWLRILGSHGVYLGDAQRPYLRIYGPDRVHQDSFATNAVASMTDHFVDCVLSHRKPMSNARDGFAMVQLTEAVLAAAATNTVVSLPSLATLLA